MDDSAMIMRMKFTSKPGKQWVIRREAYRQVKDALHAAGIKFAHRHVTVHVPGAEKGMDEQTKAALKNLPQNELIMANAMRRHHVVLGQTSVRDFRKQATTPKKSAMPALPPSVLTQPAFWKFTPIWYKILHHWKTPQPDVAFLLYILIAMEFSDVFLWY